MRALIFNSGLGSRLGELTADRPKCMVRLGSGETILHRQLRILEACGVREFVITTGPYPEQVEAVAGEFEGRGCSFEFVPNPRFAETNYIYSMWLARDLLRGHGALMLHGDLVFDAAYAQAVIDSPYESLGSVNAALPLPGKDFKARVADGMVREVSVGIFGGGCVAFQPFYKLSEAAMDAWLSAVGRFAERGDTGVYAEDAANTVFDAMAVKAFSYEGHFVEEVDTAEDLERVSAAVRLFDFEQQPVFEVNGGGNVRLADGFAVDGLARVRRVGDVLAGLGARKPLVVTAPFFDSLGVAGELREAAPGFTAFADFAPNPTVGAVERALAAYRAGGCDSLLSVGGGSAIDIAKCVKQMLALPDGTPAESLGSGRLPYSGVPHVAMPTTAGTGSESTHFAVCYVGGRKVSVASDCLQPDAVLLDPANLAGLPDYQRKCTLLDALCQAIESYWSVRSSERSRGYSSAAIPAIMESAGRYLEGDAAAAAVIMRAANQAGKAINLTTTTAPHALSYKLTSLYGIPHGHAVAVCMPHCWRMLIGRANEGLAEKLAAISWLMTGGESSLPQDGLDAFEELYASLGMSNDWMPNEVDELDILVSSVNVQRLSNFPVQMSGHDIKAVYEKVLAAR